MESTNSLQEWVLALENNCELSHLRATIERAKDDLFEFLETNNQSAELPRLSDNELKELFGFLLSEPMMWKGERDRAFLRLGT